MPTNYDHLRTLAYRLTPMVTHLPFTCQVLTFPEAWKRAILPLQRTQTDRGEDGVTIQVAALNACLLAVCPDILYIARGVGRLDNPTPWIYGLQAIPVQIIRDLVALWVHYTYTKVSAARRADVIAALDLQALAWRKHVVDLAGWDLSDGGTARERDGSQYALLAQIAAATLCAPPEPIMHGAIPLTFQRAAPVPGKNSARLVAWPPLQHAGDRFSPFLTIATHTVAFQEYPELHVDYGLIRWLGTPGAALPGGRSTVFLRSKVPWISGVLPSAHFQAAQVRWKPQENGKFKLIWDGMLAELLGQVDMPEIIDPNDLVADPVPYLESDGSFNAAIVYRYGITIGRGAKRHKLEHAVGRGYDAADRARMAEQIAQALAPTFVFTPELERIKRDKPPVQVTFNNPFGLTLVKSTDDMEEEAAAVAAETNAAIQAERRAYLARIAVDEPFVIEVWYQEDATLSVLRAVLDTEFGVGTPSADNRWQTPEVTIVLRAVPLGVQGRSLPDTERGLAHRDAIAARAQEIQQWLQAIPTPTVVLMELDGADSFPSRTDPRPALRMGGALAGRITQQVRPARTKADQKNLEHRLRMALLDVIRQRGRQPGPLHISGALGNDSAEEPNLIGIWLIKTYARHSPTGQAAHIPFVVLLPAGQTEVLCRAPGWDDWRPYADGLMSLARNDAASYPKARNAARFLETVIEEDIAPLGAAIIMVHRQNLNEAWPYIANKYLMPDYIRFGDERLRPIGELPGVRLLRLRDAGGEQETPEWYAVSGTRVSANTKGLFAIGARVFASTYGRPKSQPISSERSKSQPYQVRNPKTRTVITKDADPGAHSWNPAIIEITIAAMQPGDDPARLAFIPHILRAQAIHYDEALSLPLMLHLARLAQEYVIPIEYNQESDGGMR